jgi:uncharacterized membrane protein
MNLWRILLGIDAPPHASIQGLDLSFRGLTSPGLVILLLALLLVANAGIVVLYLFERSRMGIVRRLLLAGLRIAAVNLLILLLFLPVLIIEFQGKRPRGVVLMLDNSQSMAQEDQRVTAQDRLRVAIAEGLLPPGTAVPETGSMSDVPSDTPTRPARSRLVRAVLDNPKLNLLPDLDKPGPLRSYLFGQRLHSTSEGLLKGYKADETRTALADAAFEVLERTGDDLPTAMVIFTDGRDNGSKKTLEEAARECARLQVPLHIYGVGSSDVGNIQLKDILVPETVFYDDTLFVPLRWRVRGFKGGKATLRVKLGDLMTQKEIEIKEGEDFREVLTLTPKKRDQKEERLDLIASIEFPGAEAFTEDNVLKKPLRIIDRKVKVLYIENSARWEYKFLMTALLRDRRVDAKFLLLNASPDALKSGPPYLTAFPGNRQELFEFDLLILGDVPVNDPKNDNSLNAERIGWIRDFVFEGGGLVVISGRQHAPAEFEGTQLTELLPVEFTPTRFPIDADTRSEAFLPTLTRAGERSELLALADTQEENQKIWKELPGFYWNYPVTKLRPGAVALLTHPKLKADDLPMPLLATRNYGKGLVLFMGADETWRWRFNVRDKYFGRFWGQVIYQLGLPHLIGTQKRVQLALEKSEAVLGRPGYLYARILDSNYNPLVTDQVAGRLESTDPKTGESKQQPIVFEKVPGQPGEYRALLSHDAVGRFTVKLDSPEPATLEYRVNFPPQHELEVAGMAEDALRRTAQQSGGQFYREEDLHHLAADIKPQLATFIQRQEVLPWNPLTLLLFVLLITAEWVGRKWGNLS